MSTMNRFTVGAYNVRGLEINLEGVHSLRIENKVLVLAITETHMEPAKSIQLRIRAELASYKK